MVVVAVLLALVSCAGPLPWAQPTPTPLVVDCAALARKGVRPCPPDSPALQKPQVVNRTNGRVPDSMVQRWTRAFLRTAAYEEWAVAHNSDELLQAGILAAPEHQQQIFAFDIRNIKAAKSAGGRLEVTNARIAEIDVVAVPSELREGLQEEGYHAQDYALVIRARGASRVDLVVGNTSRTLLSVGSDSKADHFEWGRETKQSPLGLLWLLDGTSECTSDPAFQSLCSS
ncbi:MAG: hypothetical protein J2P45_13845 [Candidatus Dormibacteraeota bacterium]|nr:hypothetical protein [Candidatus Dormibacteraeota bacterium]